MSVRREESSGSLGRRPARQHTAFFKALRDKAYPKPSANASRGEPIFAQGRQVGVYYADTRTFVKRVRDCHMLQKPPAIAVDKYILLGLRERGCETVRAELVDQDRALVGDMADFMAYGVWLDRGHGEQYGLELRYWREVGGRADAAREPAVKAVLQCSLFGGRADD